MPEGRLSKPKNSRGSSRLDRRVGSLRGRTREIAIAYDGQRTEHDYFLGWARAIGTGGIELRPFYVRSGGNALRAVEATRKRVAEEGDFDEIWCVCDADDTSDSDLSKALAYCNKHNIKLCLSVRSFEVWLALHWGEISLAAIGSEKEAINAVARHFPKYNNKSKTVPFSILFPLTNEAKKNSEWLAKQGVSNPATSMHDLAEVLLNIINIKRKNI